MSAVKAVSSVETATGAVKLTAEGSATDSWTMSSSLSISARVGLGMSLFRVAFLLWRERGASLSHRRPRRTLPVMRDVRTFLRASEGGKLGSESMQRPAPHFAPPNMYGTARSSLAKIRAEARED
jgi:hypothetical protein